MTSENSCAQCGHTMSDVVVMDGIKRPRKNILEAITPKGPLADFLALLRSTRPVPCRES